jgi:hypothetical protein
VRTAVARWDLGSAAAAVGARFESDGYVVGKRRLLGRTLAQRWVLSGTSTRTGASSMLREVGGGGGRVWGCLSVRAAGRTGADAVEPIATASQFSYPYPDFAGDSRAL